MKCWYASLCIVHVLHPILFLLFSPLPLSCHLSTSGSELECSSTEINQNCVCVRLLKRRFEFIYSKCSPQSGAVEAEMDGDALNCISQLNDINLCHSMIQYRLIVWIKRWTPGPLITDIKILILWPIHPSLTFFPLCCHSSYHLWSYCGPPLCHTPRDVYCVSDEEKRWRFICFRRLKTNDVLLWEDKRILCVTYPSPAKKKAHH
jgi:hypothetical protein